MSDEAQWSSAFAPATVANLGPGFDVLGLALDPALGLGDTCRVRRSQTDGIRLTIEGDGGRLPTGPSENVASVAAAAVLRRIGATGQGLDIHLTKGLPLGSGLGSSAASAASAAIATNLALGSPLSRRELIDAGRAGEAIAAGTPHPDNVVPSLLGGLLLMVDEADGLRIVQLPVPPSLRVSVVIPELEVRTADARKVLPAAVPMADAIANIASMGLFVSGLYEGDLRRVGRGVQDRLHQPYRIPLVRGFHVAREAAEGVGALGVGMSGSGPAIFALADGDVSAARCGAAMAAAFESLGIGARWVAGGIAPALEA